jgi:hypothetical protein
MKAQRGGAAQAKAKGKAKAKPPAASSSGAAAAGPSVTTKPTTDNGREEKVRATVSTT